MNAGSDLSETGAREMAALVKEMGERYAGIDPGVLTLLLLKGFKIGLEMGKRISKETP